MSDSISAPMNRGVPTPTQTAGSRLAALLMDHGIQAAIFDLDGTLIDSMPYWSTLACDYLEACGITAAPEAEARLKTMTLREAAEWFRTEYDLPGTTDQHVAELLAAIADRYRTQIPLKPGAAAFLKRLKDAGLRLCVATATDAGLAEACLARTGALPLFDFILSCEMIGIGKGRPDIFLMAADRFGSEPACIVVFEDALHAARTAALAGFRTVGVADPSAAGERAALMALCDAWIEDYPSALEELATIPG